MRILHTEASWDAACAANALEEKGCLITRVASAYELLDFAEFGSQNAIIFELDLPDMSAAQLTKTLRRRCPEMLIYGLGSDTDWRMRTQLLELGADDVFAYTSNVERRATQIRAQACRVAGFAGGGIDWGPLHLDMRGLRVSVSGQQLTLTRKEYEIIEILALHNAQLIDREALMSHLYAWHNEPNDKIITVYLSRIRSEIKRCGGDPSILETVWGMGYRLSPEHNAA